MKLEGSLLPNHIENSAIQEFLNALSSAVLIDYPDDTTEEYAATPRWASVIQLAAAALETLEHFGANSRL